MTSTGPRLRLQPGWILGGMVAAYACVFVSLSLIKYRYYLYTDFDLAIFAQAADRLLHGSTWNSIRGMDWRGDHSSLILYLIAPVTWAFPRAPSLLVLQSVALALGALPVHRMARRMLGDETLALLCAALYLLYPAVGYSNLFEFHPEVPCTAALLAAIDALFAGRRLRLGLFAGLALLGKEDMTLAVLGIAFLAVAMMRPRAWIDAAVLVSMAAISLAVTFLWLRPAYGHGEADYARLYAAWGGSPGAMAANLLRHPWNAISALWTTPGNGLDTLGKRQLVLHLLLPLGFLPALAPLALIGALPTLAQHLLSSRVTQHAIAYHYTAALTPFFVTAAMLGLRRVRDASARSAPLRALPRVAAWVAVAAAVASQLVFGPVAAHRMFQVYRATERIWPNARDVAVAPYLDRMVARVPARGGVVASFEYLGRLAARPDLHSHHHVYQGRYTQSEKPYPAPTGIDAMLAGFGNQYDEAASRRMRELIVANQLRPVDAIDDQVLYLRNSPDTLELMRVGLLPTQPSTHVVYDGQLAFLGSDLDEVRLARGTPLTIRTYWESVAPVDRQFLTLLSLFDADDRVVFYRTRYLGYGEATPDLWPSAQPVRETYRLLLPRSLAPGRYRLVLQVAMRRGEGGGLSRPDDPQLLAAGGNLQLGVIEVH